MLFQNNLGQTALSIACDRKDLSIVKMLRDAGADMASVDPQILDALLTPPEVKPAQPLPDKPDVDDFNMTWIPGQDDYGHLTDQFGTKYNFLRHRASDGANLYKCGRSATLRLENGTKKQKICGAIACRLSTDGPPGWNYLTFPTRLCLRRKNRNSTLQVTVLNW